MQLNHDSAGFLTGDTITDIKRSAGLLSAIRSDVAAIKNAVIGMSMVGGEAATSNPAANPVIPGQSESNPAPVPNQVQAENPAVPPQPAEPRSRGRREQTEAAVERSRTSRVQADNPAEPRARDASGRFSGGGRRRQSREAAEPASSRDNRGRFTSNGDSGDQQQRTLINGLGDRIAETITGFDSGLEEVDPTVKAFNEVAQPLARGYQALFGDDEDKEKTRWFRRIFGELRLFRKEDTTFNRATRRSLGHIEDNTEGGDDGGSDSFIGGLLGSILPWMMAAITGIGGALLAGIGTVLGVIFSPIGLAIGAAATAAWGLLTEDGRKFFADMGDKIADGWDKAVAWFTKSSPKTMELLNKGVEKVSQGADAFIKNSPKTTALLNKGVESIKSGAEKATEYLKKSSPKTTEALGKASNYVKGKFDLIKAALGFDGGNTITGLSEAQTKALAAETQRTESGGDQRAENKYGFIGKYQFGADALADAGLVDLKKLKAAKKAVGNGTWYKGGQAEFLRNNDNWRIKGGKEAYLSDASLQDKSFVDFTNKNVKSGIRFGAIAKTDSAEKIAAYTKAAHLKGVGGANDLFLKNRDGRDANGTSAAKYAQDGVGAVRDLAPKIEAILRSRTETAQSVFLTSPKIPKVPSPVAVQESPGVIQPLASNVGYRAPFISLPNADVGQDLSDRKIGLIATGGLSGGY